MNKTKFTGDYEILNEYAYEDFMNKSFVNKLNNIGKEHLYNDVENMLKLTINLINQIKYEEETLETVKEQLNEFIKKMYEIKYHIDIDQWKYFIMDIIEINVEKDASSLVLIIDNFFDKCENK